MACKRSRVRPSYSPRTAEGQPKGRPSAVLWSTVTPELVTSEALLFKGGFGWIVKITPLGCISTPSSTLVFSTHKGNRDGCLFLCAENRCYLSPKPPFCKGGFSLTLIKDTLVTTSPSCNNSQFSIFNSQFYFLSLWMTLRDAFRRRA